MRSYFRFKGLPHRWILRNSDPATYQKYAKIPIIPLVVTPEDEGIQDSTPIIETVEARYPEPAIHPDDPVAAFASVLLEEFGDEWGNKWMFHYRWARRADQLNSGGRIGRTMNPDASDEEHQQIIEQVLERMTNRVWFVGSNEVTAAQIERSFMEALPVLDAHLESRPYLFGAGPAFGDFGMWGQIYNAWTDPTCGAIIEAKYPNVLAWIHRMLFPRIEGDFETWDTLAAGLTPLLKEQLGDRFMPWTLANEAAIAAGDEEFSVQVAGETWTQKPQKYHAKSLAVLRQKYAAADKAAIEAALGVTGCLIGLEA
ncbi:MAG: enoyl-CoA hydratase [Gammaproteobacteria bacterium]|nr:enoyl-CoA hydratase [Gammaproteobacteria bacterium]